MSKATKRKHVVKEVEDLSVPTESQSIVRMIESRGNNLHEVEDAAGSRYLVSMPTKFRRHIWVKRGDFILVEPIPEGDKVKAEIVKILTRRNLSVKEHKRWYREQNCWPQEFDEAMNSKEDAEGENEDDNIFINTNRISRNLNRTDDSDTSSDESDSS